MVAIRFTSRHVQAVLTFAIWAAMPLTMVVVSPPDLLIWTPQPRRLALDLNRQVRQAGRYALFEEAWFDPAGCLYHFLPILCLRRYQLLLAFLAMKSKLLPICFADH